MTWAYGITTVRSRLETLLPQTIESLDEAGFDQPRLFIDGPANIPDSLKKFPITHRPDRVYVVGNWMLSALELYLRNPKATRYAIFQDDFITYRNLRQYLDRCVYPKKGYWNLYTFPQNEIRAHGWLETRQTGKGAVALVFNNEAMRLLLASPYMIDRVQDSKRGHVSIDGAIVTAMNNLGWKEYCHQPSLVQHTGIETSMGPEHRKQPLSVSFKGEEFDAMDLIPVGV